ncbi:MAG: Enoyl-CoA hydratase/isomerase [Actinomycetia bacterium]|nr:Enoyl-CoA hydratase/isomerase [Actinomycetes bacterium]
MGALAGGEQFSRLKFESPAEGVLRVVIDTAAHPLCDEVMHRELGEVWRAIDRDPAVRAVVIQGSGEGFSGPGTPGMVGSLAQDDAARTRVQREAREMVYNVLACSKPVISAIHGPTLGAGLGIALLADVPIAGKSALLIDAHVQIGVVPGDHAVLCWPLQMGMAKAKYYLLTGDPIPGEEAERLGLVALCVDDDVLFDTALQLAKRFAAGSTPAIAGTKAALNAWYHAAAPAFEASLAQEFLGFTGPDFAEALAAFATQRAPQFDHGDGG